MRYMICRDINNPEFYFYGARDFSLFFSRALLVLAAWNGNHFTGTLIAECPGEKKALVPINVHRLYS